MRALGVVGLLWLGACAGDLTPGTVVTRLRNLGVRVSVEGQPTQSQPNPGERVRFELVLRAPGALPSYDFALAACARAPNPTGADGCADTPFFVDAASRGEGEGLSASFELPAALDVERGVLFGGALCEGSALNFDFAETLTPGSGATLADVDASCSNEEVVPALFFLPVQLRGEGAGNQHPELPADFVSLSGTPLTADLASAGVAPLGPCSATDLPQVSASAETTAQLSYRFPDDLRELDPEEGPEAREVIQISNVSNFGEPGRQFTVFEDTLEGDVSLDFDALRNDEERAQLSSEGIAVRLDIMVRDLRGGFTHTERALCVVP